MSLIEVAGQNIEVTQPGVCLVIPVPEWPEYFLMTLEKKLKRGTNKVPGQWGLGYESVEAGETQEDAIKRYLKEEIVVEKGSLGIPKKLDESLLCACELSSGAWVFAYPAQPSSDLVLRIGSEIEEIGGLRLVRHQDVISNREDHPELPLYRTGTKIIIENYLRWLDGEENFVPQVVPIEHQKDRIPEAVFDYIEKDKLSSEEALSRLGLRSPTALDFRAPDRLQLRQVHRPSFV